MNKRLRYASALVCAGVSVAAYATDDVGLKRSAQFWLRAFPIYIHYRVVQLQSDALNWSEQRSNSEYQRLHDLYSPIAEEGVFRLKGYYLKQAQLLSLRSDFIPEQYIRWMRRTQNEVPAHLEPGQWRVIVEEQLDRPMHEVFAWYDDTPLAIASIGEVHRARLLNGREVVVKVQSPGIEHLFRNDIGNGKRFCRLAMPQHLAALQEIEKQFATEFDYVGEARNLERVYANVMPTWGDRVCIPRPVAELCTKYVLVMDYLPGKRLDDSLKEQMAEFARSHGMDAAELHSLAQSKRLRCGDFTYSSPEELSRSLRALKHSLWLRDTFYSWNGAKLLYNCTLAWLPGLGPLEYQRSLVPIDLGEVLQLLMAVHAYEIFHDGLFNADPHPGNVLLLPDGRLGLIDYGQVKELPLETRINYAKLLLAINRGDSNMTCDIAFKKFGVKTTHANREVVYRWASFWHDRDTDDVTDGRTLTGFLQWCEHTDPIINIPTELVLTSRVSTMMRGMGLVFGLRLSTATHFAPFARQLLLDCQLDPLKLDNEAPGVP